MKVIKKVTILVSIQIFLIFASFLILTFFESQKTFAGNSVNVAGKNRLLTSKVIIALKDYQLNRDSEGKSILALNELKENMVFLRDGGTRASIHLHELQQNFEEDWNKVNEKYLELEESILKIVNIKNKEGFVSSEQVEFAEQKSVALIDASDILTNKLGFDLEKLSNLLIQLQIILAGINVGAHIFLIYLIVKIFRKESEEKSKIEKLATIGEFSSRIAHDLRNPLGVIKLNMRMLKPKIESTLDEKSKERLESVDNAVNRMSHQIDDIMDYVRIKPVIFEETPVSEIINDTLARLKIPNTVKIQLPENDLKIFCDKEKLVIVMINLISNALDAINYRGQISIRTFEKDKNTVIEVEDSGPGIENKNLSKIFEPLFTTKEKGTGLGLASCKSIIEQHRGVIFVKTEPTIFSITLPKK